MIYLDYQATTPLAPEALDEAVEVAIAAGAAGVIASIRRCLARCG